MNTILFRTLLGGRKNFSFSLDCITSFTKYCKNNYVLEVFEDGTLSPKQTSLLESLPNVSVVPKALRDSILAQKLLEFPNCLSFKNSHILANKLFDTMLYNSQNFYYLDSDILFLNNFKFEENFPDEPIFMKDTESCYSFSFSSFYNNKWKILSKVNTGIMHFPNEKFNLNQLEEIIERNFNEQNLKSCWAEQTMWAFMASVHKSYYFSSEQIVMATPFVALKKNTIAVHLTTPYRYKAGSMKSFNNHPEVTLINKFVIKSYLHPLTYLISMLYYKAQRKTMKLLTIMPKEF